MINSRSLEYLLPVVRTRAEHHIKACALERIDIVVTSTFRDHASQQVLYNQGRTLPGDIVTNAEPGYSLHNWQCAYDVVPVVMGKAIWKDKDLWLEIGEIGEACGLEWAGRWKTFKESAHFQYTNGLTIDDLMTGKKIG